MDKQSNALFVWRGVMNVANIFNEDELENVYCPFCKVRLSNSASRSWPYGAGCYDQVTIRLCSQCGWLHSKVAYFEHGYLFGNPSLTASSLRSFNINDTELTLDELGTHIRNHFADVNTLSWKKFEDLAADIFRQTSSYRVIQTPFQKDGGADLLLLTKTGNTIDAIVECKKYRTDRKIGVKVVREVIGAAVDWNVKKATLFTTCEITSDARYLASRYGANGYSLSLVDSTELLKMLECYNTLLPSLDKIDSGDLEALRKENAVMTENMDGQSDIWRARLTFGDFIEFKVSRGKTPTLRCLV